MVRVKCGQPKPSRQLDGHIAMEKCRRATRHDQAAVRELRECGNGTLDIAGIARVDRAHLHPERWGRGLDRGELASPGRYVGISQERHSLYARRDLLE